MAGCCDRCGDTHDFKNEILCNHCQYEVKKKRVIKSPFLPYDISGEILEGMPTIKQGMAANLKIERDGYFNVLLDRLTFADYDGNTEIMPPNWPVIFERMTDKGWRACDANGRLI